jgi:hypothetical protein
MSLTQPKFKDLLIRTPTNFKTIRTLHQLQSSVAPLPHQIQSSDDPLIPPNSKALLIHTPTKFKDLLIPLPPKF